MISNTLKRLSALTVLTMASSFAVFGQAGEVKKVDLYVASLDALTKASDKPHFIFADTSDYEDSESKPLWRRFESEEVLTKYREDEKETYKVAFVWTKDGKVVVSNFTLFSPSGDWAQYDLHYFRADGSIAKIVSELRTFFGEFVLKREIWYSTKGVQIRSSRSYRDLETGRVIKRPKDSFETDIERYKKSSNLPFFNLLSKSE